VSTRVAVDSRSGESRAICLCARRQQKPMARASSIGDGGRARWRCGRPPAQGDRRVAFVRTSNRRRALALAAAEILSAATPNDRGRHRYQRKTPSPPSPRQFCSGSVTPRPASATSGGAQKRTIYGSLTRRIRLRCSAARRKSPARLRICASRGVIARARPVPARRGAHSVPAVSPTPRDTYGITIPTSRII